MPTITNITERLTKFEDNLGNGWTLERLINNMGVEHFSFLLNGKVEIELEDESCKRLREIFKV